MRPSTSAKALGDLVAAGTGEDSAPAGAPAGAPAEPAAAAAAAAAAGDEAVSIEEAAMSARLVKIYGRLEEIDAFGALRLAPRAAGARVAFVCMIL